ncbi:hypothetical protein KY345_04835 [Candidatus Woesearchaeota archaeon]|nr:hypothetical protein [Candidatus Woesearchaeota archaeon]
MDSALNLSQQRQNITNSRRFLFDFYKFDYRPFLQELIAEQEDFVLPAETYMRDIAICVWDTRNTTMAAFICGVAGKSDTAYMSHFILRKDLRQTKDGIKVLKILRDNLNKILLLKGITAHESFISEKNIRVFNLHKKRGGKILGKGYLIRHEIKKND